MSSTPNSILRAVAKAARLPASAIQGRSQAVDIAPARHLYWYLLNTVLGLSFEEVAQLVGFNRRAVRYGVRRVEDRRDDSAFEALVTSLERTLE